MKRSELIRLEKMIDSYSNNSRPLKTEVLELCQRYEDGEISIRRLLLGNLEILGNAKNELNVLELTRSHFDELDFLAQELYLEAKEELEHFIALATVVCSRLKEIYELGREQKEVTRIIEEINPKPMGALCSSCGKRHRHFDDLCKRCANEQGVRPSGKIE